MPPDPILALISLVGLFAYVVVGSVVAATVIKKMGHTDHAKALAEAGVFAIVLECVPPDIAAEVTAASSVPIIGIGAGPICDGQVLVMHDLLGLSENPPPKFVKPYAALADTIRNAFRAYADEVRSGAFPAAEHCYAPSGQTTP